MKYPNIHVTLCGEDGNACAILGAVTNAMRKAGLPASEIDTFKKEAMSKDYDKLLQTCLRWVDCQ
jgi:hypothetical protein